MTEPKLLTEAEARDLLERYTEDGVIDELRERGLIAPEQPPELDYEAWRPALNAYYNSYNGCTKAAHPMDKDDKGEIRNLIAALPLAPIERPELTREMVAAAWEHYTVNGPYGTDGLHAALIKQMQP